MKGYFKGLITGLILAAVVCMAPAVAENISVMFNSVRINVDGYDVIQWGENITASDGTAAPSSILYNGTTYLPMRKLGEYMDKKVYWNGDSNTVAITDTPSETNDLVEKPDANGNVWKYYTFKAGEEYYLGVKDEARGYERVYNLANTPENAINVTDDAIYFIESAGGVWHYGRPYRLTDIVKLSFNNTPDTQDGEILNTYRGLDVFILSNDFIYYITKSDSSKTTYIIAVNYITGESDGLDYYMDGYTAFSGLKIVESTEDADTLTCPVPAVFDGSADKIIILDKNTVTLTEVN